METIQQQTLRTRLTTAAVTGLMVVTPMLAFADDPAPDGMTQITTMVSNLTLLASNVITLVLTIKAVAWGLTVLKNVAKQSV